MNERTRRFTTLRDLALSREQEAAKLLAACNQKIAEHRRQLADLQQFREEYSQQFHNVGNRGIESSRMRDHWQFLQKLDRAIETQMSAIKSAERELSKSQSEWHKKYSRTRAMDGLLTECRREDRRRREHRAQVEIDDKAGRRR